MQHQQLGDQLRHRRLRRGSCTASCRRSSRSARVNSNSSISSELRVACCLFHPCFDSIFAQQDGQEAGGTACARCFCVLIPLRMGKKRNVIIVSVWIGKDDRGDSSIIWGPIFVSLSSLFCSRRMPLMIPLSHEVQNQTSSAHCLHAASLLSMKSAFAFFFFFLICCYLSLSSFLTSMTFLFNCSAYLVLV